MGYINGLAIGVALALGAALSPMVAVAQDSGVQTSPPNLQDFRLDPAQDPNRPQPPQRVGPEIDNRPPVQAAPPAATVPVSPPVAAPALTPPRTTATVAPPLAVPAETKPNETRPVETRSVKTGPITAPAVASGTAKTGMAETPRAVPSSPVPTPTVVPDATPRPDNAPPAPAGSSPLPWIIGLIVALIAGGLALLVRRRRPAQDAPFEETDIPTAAPAPRSAAKAPAPVAPAPPAPAATPVPIPVPAAKMERPRAGLSIAFYPLSARNTLVAVTIGYRLVLHNDGEDAIEAISIAAILANADSGQEQALAAFFAAAPELPTHQVARIEPGADMVLTGELRLDHAAIEPIRINEQSLLIPVIAFSAHYGWAQDGRGYSGAAFILGQESDPPRPRMAPFRLDQGPRQYRSVGSRPALSALVS
ncbi:hypothetical protein BH10PSE12_BH10PSE12_15950 [soil metagenome]